MATRYIFIDTETTGLSRSDEIVEIAAVEFDEKFVPTRIFHEYLDPGIPVGDSQRFHGLTDEFLIGRKSFADIAGEFVEFIKGATIFAHNMSFDSRFIDSALTKCGFGTMDTYAARIIDTLKIAQQQYYGDASLDSLIKRFGIDGSSRVKHHGALIDSELLAKVYLHLIGSSDIANGIDFGDVNRSDAAYQEGISRHRQGAATAYTPHVSKPAVQPSYTNPESSHDKSPKESITPSVRPTYSEVEPPKQNTKLFSSVGRLSRWEFAKVFLAYIICAPILGVLLRAAEKSDSVFPILAVSIGLVAISIVITFALIKRCADARKSPYWALVGVVPLISLLLVIWLFFLPSQANATIDNVANKRSAKVYLAILFVICLVSFFSGFKATSNSKPEYSNTSQYSPSPQQPRYVSPQHSNQTQSQPSVSHSQPQGITVSPDAYNGNSEKESSPRVAQNTPSEPKIASVGGFDLQYEMVYLNKAYPSRVFYIENPNVGRFYCENCTNWDGNSALTFVGYLSDKAVVTIFVAPKGSTLGWENGIKSSYIAELISCDNNNARKVVGIYSYTDYFLGGKETEVSGKESSFPWEPEPVRSLVFEKMVRPIACRAH